MQNNVRILFIGDIIGKTGRAVITKRLKQLKDELEIDFTIANGENLAGGFGITRASLDPMFAGGIDCFTSGNHIWDNKDGVEMLHEKRILRPLNYNPELPGHGTAEFNVRGTKIIVANLCGRIFMQPLDCPFRKMDEFLKGENNKIVFVDFHAEATAEKQALAYYLDGRVSAVVGTHTHVQTADERILTYGTGFITDAGMTGSIDSIIGFEPVGAIRRTIMQIPQRFEVAKSKPAINAVFFNISTESLRTTEIKRIFEYVED